MKDSNTWLIITLIISTLLGPGIVWKIQQRNLDRTRISLDNDKLQMQKTINDLQLKIEKEKIEMQKNDQLIYMYDKLCILLDEQRVLYKQHVSSENEFQMQEIRSKMDEKNNEMDAISILQRFNGFCRRCY